MGRKEPSLKEEDSFISVAHDTMRGLSRLAVAISSALSAHSSTEYLSCAR